ncbi:hypothetical protein [Mycolicibacterium neoaurum]|uniref:hypothetical protein n=1 Tax=Mycolicibacterium neoaurum TaxID=1795 RepID=UPI001F4D2BE0|nr:hypothetical protein [Mycolicibacterium neoaurum]
MALMKRLAMRRKDRDTSKEALPLSPPMPNAEQANPADQPAAPMPPPETQAPNASIGQPSFAEALMPNIDEPAAPAHREVPPPDMAGPNVEPSKQEQPATDLAALDHRRRSATGSGSAGPADHPASRPEEEPLQMPQWQYATKRARRNQHRPRK